MWLTGCELRAGTAEQRSAVAASLSLADTPFMVLDTCQRLECFGQGVPQIDSALIVRQHDDEDAFERLARIAAGLESRIVGEREVLGQVRRAYCVFRKRSQGTGHDRLDRTLQKAIALARAARCKSGIDRNLPSLGSLAAHELLARTRGTEPVAVIGCGALARNVARHVLRAGSHALRVVGRRSAGAEALAQQLGAMSMTLDQLDVVLEHACGVVTATSAPRPIVTEEHLARLSRRLVIVDLGVPPDCAPGVSRFADVDYVSLALVESCARKKAEERQRLAEIAGRIIREGIPEWS